MTPAGQEDGEEAGALPGDTGLAPSTGPIGGGAVDELVRLAAQADVGKLPVASASDPTAFVTEVVKFARARARRGPALSAPVVFVFSAYPASEAARLGFQRALGFKTHFERDVSGVVVVSAASLGEAFVSLPTCTDIASAFATLAELGLGRLPTVIVEPGGDLVECRRGALADGECVRYPIRTLPVTVESIDEMLNRFYRHWIERPTDASPIWHDKERFVPCDRAERVIQGLLVPYATSVFEETHIVRPEDNVRSGRSDVVVQPYNAEVAGGSALLEMKVLRARHFDVDARAASRCSDSENAKAVAKGITQAVNYRRDHQCDHAFVCAYDLRDADDDDVIARHRPQAIARNVHLRRYFAYNSSDAFRRAQPGAAQAVLRPRRGPGRRSAGGDSSGAQGAQDSVQGDTASSGRNSTARKRSTSKTTPQDRRAPGKRSSAAKRAPSRPRRSRRREDE